MAPIVTATQLRAYVNAPSADDSFLADLVETATDLVQNYVGAADVPDSVLKQSALEVGAKLYQRRNAPMGDYGEAGGYGGTLLAPKDPMVTAYPLLNRFMVKGL